MPLVHIASPCPQLIAMGVSPLASQLIALTASMLLRAGNFTLTVLVVAMSEILQVNVGFSALRVHEHGRALLYNLGQASGPLIHSC